MSKRPSLTAAVEAALAAAPDVEPWRAAMALHLAADADGDGPLTARTSAAKMLLNLMPQLAGPASAAAAPAETGDRLDELSARRRMRRAS